MSKKSSKTLLLFDLSISPPKDQDYSSLLETEEWKNEADVLRALKKLGHDVKLLGVKDNIQPLIEEIQSNRPDLVFNMSEAFSNNRDFEPHLVALLELLRVPHTGANSWALRLCKDKGLTKKILSFHRIRVPKFVVSHRSAPIRALAQFPYPAFIKPLGLEASEGIAQVSLAHNEKDCMERVRYIHEKLGTDAIVEEFIDGREIYVGVLGNKRPTVLPPREIFFSEVPDGEPIFATYKAKWDENYRKRWGIKNGPAAPIEPKVLENIQSICKKIYRLFQLSGYARVDLRLKPDGEVVFIEVNPNPSVAASEDFAQAAKKAGIPYDELISKIVDLSAT